MKRTLTLTVSFNAETEGDTTRKIRSLLKWLGRTWRLRVETIHWTDEQPKPPKADASTPPYRGK